MAEATLTPLPRSADKYSDSSMLPTVAPSYVTCKHKATNFYSRMLAMKTAKEIRYENLLDLLKRYGEGDLTAMLEATRSWANEGSDKRLSRKYLDQILKGVKTANGTPRGIGDDLARQIEHEFWLDTGWMDTPQGQQTGPKEYLPPTQEQLGALNWLFMKIKPEFREDILDAAKAAFDAQEKAARGGG